MADLDKSIEIHLRYIAELRGIIDATKATVDQGKATDELTRKLQAAERELRKNEQAAAALQVRQEAMARVAASMPVSAPAFNVAGATGRGTGNPSLASVDAMIAARVAAANNGPGVLSELRQMAINAGAASGLPGGAAVARFATNPYVGAVTAGGAAVREFAQEESVAARLRGMGLGGQETIETIKQLAIVLNTDLESASETYIRAANGMTRTLTMVGFQFKENATMAERLASIQEQAAAKSAALLEARSATLSGQLFILKKEAGDVLQNFGALIGGTGLLQTAMGLLTVPLKLVNALFDTMRGKSKETGASVTSDMGDMEEAAVEAGGKVEELAGKFDDVAESARKARQASDELTDAESAAAKAEIDLLEARGLITPEQATRGRAAVDAKAETLKLAAQAAEMNANRDAATRQIGTIDQQLQGLATRRDAIAGNLPLSDSESTDLLNLERSERGIAGYGPLTPETAARLAELRRRRDNPAAGPRAVSELADIDRQIGMLNTQRAGAAGTLNALDAQGRVFLARSRASFFQGEAQEAGAPGGVDFGFMRGVPGVNSSMIAQMNQAFAKVQNSQDALLQEILNRLGEQDKSLKALMSRAKNQ